MTDRLDYHNGKTVTDVSDGGGITLEDGTVIPQDRLLSIVPNEIVGTKLLKVDTEPPVPDGQAYLVFGHPASNPAQGPVIVGTVEAVGDDLTA